MRFTRAPSRSPEVPRPSITREGDGPVNGPKEGRGNPSSTSSQSSHLSTSPQSTASRWGIGRSCRRSETSRRRRPSVCVSNPD